MAQSGSMKLLGARNMSCIVERMEWNNKMDLIAYGTEKGALNPNLEVHIVNYNLCIYLYCRRGYYTASQLAENCHISDSRRGCTSAFP